MAKEPPTVSELCKAAEVTDQETTLQSTQCSPTPPLQHPVVSPELGFALMLESACSAFETLQASIVGAVVVQADSPRAASTIRMALAQSFLFHACRAYRICEHSKGRFDLPREARKQFEKILKPVVDVRDVNEHGYDLSRNSGKPISRPTMHVHEEYRAALDETSLMILGVKDILMGPLNLWDVYQPVAAMRSVAGFEALRAKESATWSGPRSC